MVTSSSDSVLSLQASRVVVPVGASNAVFVPATQGENSLIVKYYAGGTCEIFGCTLGFTLTPTQLALSNQTGYLLGTSEALSIGGNCAFYLSSTGATSIVMILQGTN